jgi:hypothetical protein
MQIYLQNYYLKKQLIIASLIVKKRNVFECDQESEF